MAKQSKQQTPIKESNPSVPQAATNTQASTGQINISKLIYGKEQYFLLAAIAISCFIIFYDFISSEKVYLFKDIGSDSVNIYYPWLVHMSDYIKNNGIPSWSFSQGLGQNVFPLWLGDVFSNILTLFSKERLPYLIAYMEIAKIFLCGIVFFRYLLELKLSRLSASIGAYMFAFCGYIILGGCWTIFSVEALYVAIILYGFERWLNHGKILWFVVGICALSFLQPFLLFPHTLFLAGYILVRYNDTRGNEWGRFPLFLAKTIGLSVLAVAMSCYQLFPDLLQYIESPRVGGDASLIARLKEQPAFALAESGLRFTTTFRAFGSDMLGTGTDFKGWQNYLEAPLFYCGIACLVLFTQVFQSFNKRQKIAYGILTGLFVLPIFFPFFRYTFWAYTGDYFRSYSLVISLLLIIFSARALDHILKNKKINMIVLGATLAGLLILLFTPTAEFAENISQGERSTSTLLLIVYAAILVGLTRSGNIRNVSIASLIIVCFFEMTLYSYTTVNDRDHMTATELTEKTGYNDYTVDAVAFIKKQDHSFYRINKSYASGPAIHPSYNDPKVQGYFSVATYSSFNQKNYVKFLGALDVINPKDELQTRWIVGPKDRPLLLTLTSGKYWLTKAAVNEPKSYGYDSLAKFGDVIAYKNTLSIPLGVTYSQVMDEATFTKLSPPKKDIYLLRGVVIDTGDNELLTAVNKYNLADTTLPTTLELYIESAKALRKDSLTITSFKESHIQGTINVNTPRILFFSIPFDEGWKATINGKDIQLHRIDCGLMGLKLPAGKSTVDLQFEPRYMMKGLFVSLASLLVFISLLFLSRKKQAATA